MKNEVAIYLNDQTLELGNYYRNHLSKEQVISTDHFCFRKPVTKLVHIRYGIGIYPKDVY